MWINILFAFKLREKKKKRDIWEILKKEGGRERWRRVRDLSYWVQIWIITVIWNTGNKVKEEGLEYDLLYSFTSTACCLDLSNRQN